MNDSPLQRARLAAIAKESKNSVDQVKKSNVVENTKNELAAIEAEKEQAKTKTKKKTDAEPESELVAEIPSEPEREVFPPVLENKAIQPEEVKESTNEIEEVL